MIDGIISWVSLALKSACLFAALFLFFLEPCQAGSPLTIRVSTQHPLSMPTSPPIAFFKKRVEELSGGTLHVAIFDSGDLYKDSQIAAAVTSGSVEMGLVELSRYAPAIPAVDVFQLPFLFADEGLEQRATDPKSEIRKLIENAITSRFGVRVLWWSSLGRTVIQSKGASVANPKSLANRTVRINGPVTASVVRDCGGVPVDVEGPNIEEGFESGKIDMAMTGIATVMGRRLWRYIDTVTRTNQSSVQFVVVMNPVFWDALTPAQKSGIEKAAGEAGVEAQRITAEIEASAYRDLQRERQIKVVDLTKDDLTLWRICSSDVLVEYLDKGGPLGHDLMRAYGRMLAAP